jgi:hypothetical protein
VKAKKDEDYRELTKSEIDALGFHKTNSGHGSKSAPGNRAKYYGELTKVK